MRKISLFIILITISLIVSSCEYSRKNVNISKLDKIYQDIYYENDYEAGFINSTTKKNDIMLTYRSFLINDYFGDQFKINRDKLKIVVYSRLLDMTDISKINRGLSNEKETIDLANELQINLENNLKTKIIRTLEQYLIKESEKVPKNDPNAINNNQQYKTQIHYNFLYIANKFDLEISQSTIKLIIKNLSSVENDLSDIDKKSIKALYYIFMVKYYLNIPINRNEIIEKLQDLKMSDGGYRFLPIEDQKKINLYTTGSNGESSDIFSTRLANEILFHLNYHSEGDIEKTVHFLIQAINNINYLNDDYLYINNMYEVVYLSKIIGYNQFVEINTTGR
ncbi:hypothetical protein [Paenibacillus caui]|uniref:hypothetical protein n=1 Tax=Paenibacillus caui TaxID=2873927 RepID=UPI001CA8C0F0|nr:hypothetical protein [Paenibacillus caui]